jgi:hypothetical protein
MIEDSKENPNCIVKAFENNPISILHEEINNKKEYYFKATDIAKVLCISQIRSSIQNFDDDEKVVRKVDDLRGCFTLYVVCITPIYITPLEFYRIFNLNAFYFKNLFKDI